LDEIPRLCVAHLFMALLNMGTAKASSTLPKAASTITSVNIACVPAPSTMTFIRASAA
jgi:hypothetical protein